MPAPSSSGGRSDGHFRPLAKTEDLQPGALVTDGQSLWEVTDRYWAGRNAKRREYVLLLDCSSRRNPEQTTVKEPLDNEPVKRLRLVRAAPQLDVATVT